jgi:hypothetical protein
VIVGVLVLAVLTYGTLIPFMGYYWDGWGFAWLPRTFGPEGLTRYFAPQRPVWGLLYQVSTPLLGENPIAWQLFGLLTRVLSGLACYWLVSLIWPRRRLLPLLTALFFVAYPGFIQQAIGNLYGHFFLELSLRFYSLAAMIKAMDDPKRAAFWWPSSWATSLFTVFGLEYFFGLELLRPVILWLALLNRNQLKTKVGPAIKQVLQIVWPYLAFSLAYVLWRAFGLTFQTYQPSLLKNLAQQPLTVLIDLAITVLRDISLSGLLVWLLPLSTLQSLAWPSLTSLASIILILVTAVVASVFLRWNSHYLVKENNAANFAQIVGFSLLALLSGGIPFWVTQLPLSFSFSFDRLTIPMMFGSSLLVAAIIGMLKNWRLQALIISLLLALSVGHHFQILNDYREEWDYQRSFYQQLIWRAPHIAEGTALISLEFSTLWSMSDNSLIAPINWIYAPGNNGQQLSYTYLYIPLRLGGRVTDLEPNARLSSDIAAAVFEGNTNQMLALYFDPPGCLRVLDKTYDTGYPMIPDELRAAIQLSRPQAWVTYQPQAKLPEFVEPLENPTTLWCFYFQQADLARQLGDWTAIVELAESAFPLQDSPNHPVEYLPFIEAYARQGYWGEAFAYSREAYRINAFMAPMLCNLWGRVEQVREFPSGVVPEITQMREDWACIP